MDQYHSHELVVEGVDGGLCDCNLTLMLFLYLWKLLMGSVHYNWQPRKFACCSSRGSHCSGLCRSLAVPPCLLRFFSTLPLQGLGETVNPILGCMNRTSTNGTSTEHFDPNGMSTVTFHTCDILTPIHKVQGFYLYPCLRVDILSLVTSCPPSFTCFVTFCPSVTYFQPVSCWLFPILWHLALMFFMFHFPILWHFVPLQHFVFGVTSCLCMCVCVPESTNPWISP